LIRLVLGDLDAIIRELVFDGLAVCSTQAKVVENMSKLTIIGDPAVEQDVQTIFASSSVAIVVLG
jgi:hypothetical protein